MLIRCDECAATVDAKCLSVNDSPRNDGLRMRTEFLVCPVCRNTLVAGDLVVPGAEYFPKRLWPSTDDEISSSIPTRIAEVLKEADDCLRNKTLNGARVLYGRTIEALCRKELKISDGIRITIAKGLRELKQNGVIDNRIYDWGDKVREHRNFGAHDSTIAPSPRDVEDIKDFVHAICDYIYVLTAKYEEFKHRGGGNPDAVTPERSTVDSDSESSK